jgi:hypothetical protein
MTDSPVSIPFVVLRHTNRDGVHYDLMIDAGAALATWKCTVAPETALESPMACRRLADHRRDYLTYEGPISQDRGVVTQYDCGRCRLEVGLAPDFASATCLRITFSGRKLKGPMVIERLGFSDQDWRLRSAGD